METFVGFLAAVSHVRSGKDSMRRKPNTLIFPYPYPYLSLMLSARVSIARFSMRET